MGFSGLGALVADSCSWYECFSAQQKDSQMDLVRSPFMQAWHCSMMGDAWEVSGYY